MRRSTFAPFFFALLAALSLTACAGSNGRPFEGGNIPPGKTLSNKCHYNDGKYSGPDCTLEDLPPGTEQIVVPTVQQRPLYGVAPAADPYSMPWIHGHQMVPLNGPMYGHKTCDRSGLWCSMPNGPVRPRAPEWAAELYYRR